MSNRTIGVNVKLTYNEYDMGRYVQDGKPSIFSHKKDSSLILGCLYGDKIFPCKVLDDVICVMDYFPDGKKVANADSYEYHFERYVDGPSEKSLPTLKPGLVFRVRDHHTFLVLKLADNTLQRYVLVEYDGRMDTYLFTSASALFKFIKDQNLILVGEQC